jgi:hypothetical protein
MFIEILLHFVHGEPKINTTVDFVLQHRLLHHLVAHRATEIFWVQTTLDHRLVKLLDRGDALLLGDLQHAPVHFCFDLGSHVEFLAALQQKLLVDQRRDQFGLFLGGFFRRLLFGHAALFQRFDAFFHLALQHREREDVVVDLHDHFVNDRHLAFLGDDTASTRREHREGKEGCNCKVFKFHNRTPMGSLVL